MVHIGIDPGLQGALACVDGPAVDVQDMPTLDGRVDVSALWRIFTMWICHEEMAPCHAWIEKAQAMPGGHQGVQGMFKYGLNYGLVLATLQLHHVPYTECHPGQWKKHLGLSKDKDACRLRAQQLFPACDLSKKKHDGRSEALLLAWYGIQQYAKMTT